MRIVTINLWGAREPLDLRLGALAAGLAVLAPDVILTQEVRVAEDLPSTAGRLADALGLGFVYGCATRGEAGVFGPGSGAGEEGLAILTPHTVEASRSLPLPESRPDEGRALLSAVIAAPEGRIIAHTTHLHWRLGDGVARERQAAAADALARGFGEEAGVDALHVLGGDFNAAPDCDEIRFLRGRHTLEGRRTYWQDAWLAVHPEEPGHTWARRNPMTDHLGWLERDRRIDYVFVRPERRDGRGRVLDARVVLDAPAADGTWPSDHFGVCVDVRV